MACMLEGVLSLAAPYKLIENTAAITSFIYKCFRPVCSVPRKYGGRRCDYLKKKKAKQQQHTNALFRKTEQLRVFSYPFSRSLFPEGWKKGKCFIILVFTLYVLHSQLA